uniref:Uncharacterized protein n=1 Tax=Arundo donax TaxID=35708 RepID=A0A0A9B583_ARUDO
MRRRAGPRARTAVGGGRGGVGVARSLLSSWARLDILPPLRVVP